MNHGAWVINNGLVSRIILIIVQACILMPKALRADRRCPLPQPISAGDTRLDVRQIAMDQLPSEVRNAVLGIIPADYKISLMVKSNFSEDQNTSDYLVFYDNSSTASADASLRHRLSVARSSPTQGVQISPVLWAGASADSWESGLADIRTDDLNIYKSSKGKVYAKTIGYVGSNCWETVISWDSVWFAAENIFFGTSDGFNYPVSPRDVATGSIYPVNIQTADLPYGWKIDQGFQDCLHFLSDLDRCKHLGEDWNDVNGGNSDLGHPVFAVSRGEVIFAGNGGTGWNGIVVLRHRPPTGKDIYSFYGHLNIDPNAKRTDKSAIRTVAEVIRQSVPGHLVEVEKGQLVGYIGPGPENEMSHLHFEIIVDPAIAYDKSKWVGYKSLYGSEVQWRNPSKFIGENRSYWSGFDIKFEECYGRNGGPQVFGKSIGIVFDAPYANLSLNVKSWASQAFQNGEIYYYTDDQSLNEFKFAILNPYLAKFRMLSPARVPMELLDMWGYKPIDISKGPLGLPVTDMTPVAEISSYNTQFKFQNFEGGVLEFHQTGVYAGEVFEIHGTIFKRWSGPELQYAAGPLGLPITDEKEAAKSKLSGHTGRFSVFEGGVIHWIREEDKTYVIGLNQNVGGRSDIGKLVADRYKTEGGSGGNLGFPVSDDYLWQDGIRCDFEGGYIVWTPSADLQVIYQ